MDEKLHSFMNGSDSYFYSSGSAIPVQGLFLSGSFNPFHMGHQGLLDAAIEVSDRSGCLELSIENVDKPVLDMSTVVDRLAGIPEQVPVLLTRAPTFLEKAELFPEKWFAMGYDTAMRLLDSRYHTDVPAMLERFFALESRFIVAGRLHQGVYHCLDRLPIDSRYRPLFIPISEALFRQDISSTELRSPFGYD
ncbi:MAG TPA: hypothetical protein DD620_00115 [Verrucomicrobia bacterium]|mgnify:CR=1 FL=1|nr:hypothetical protein [Verrucomicrobiota bacterium]|tara:strand:+ start:2102 stop:2680 length:579 start_codon:yes stop_codon:yes gene_type:complete